MGKPGDWCTDGPPSSLDVLVQWLVHPGNFGRWLERQQPLRDFEDEIYELLQSRGLHRSRYSIGSKLSAVVARFRTTKNWLVQSGVTDVPIGSSLERLVLRKCPGFFELDPVLSNAPTLTPKHYRADRNDSCAAKTHDMKTRSATLQQSELCETKKHRRKQLVWSEDAAENELALRLGCSRPERRELFQLELQVKRDQATCVRARSRKELFELGMSRKDVDRLLPL